MEKQVLESLVQEGLSTYKIAKQLGKSQSNVMYWLQKHGLAASKKKTTILACQNCGGEVIKKSSNRGMFCSIKCQQAVAGERRVAAWLDGSWTEKPQQTPDWIRRYMLEKHSCACSICGWNKRHPVDGLPLVEVDHIDGDATNHEISNLQVVCPNCHSETSTFRARNKESTRTYRVAYS